MANGRANTATAAVYNLLQSVGGYESKSYQLRLGRMAPNKQTKGKGKLVHMHLSRGRRGIGHYQVRS